MTHSIITITLIFFVGGYFPLKAQCNSHDIIGTIENKNGLTCLNDSMAKDSVVYSLFEELQRDGLFGENHKIDVIYSILVKNKDRTTSRPYDFIIEKWTIENDSSIKSIHNILSEAIYDTFYEKPPKVVLTCENVVFIISTWGAVYREDLYQMQDQLAEKYGMSIL